MKRVLGSLLLAVLALSSLAASGSKEEPKSQKPLHFVYVSPLLAHPVWLIAKEGFERACTELGVKGDWVGPQGISPEEMAKLVETAVAEKANGIITQGLVPAGPVQDAIDAGVRVIVVDSPIEDLKNYLAFIGKDVNIQAGLIYKDAVKTFGNKGTIKASIQVAALNYKLAVDAIDAIKKAFANYGGSFEIVNISESKSDKMKATTEWENTFKAYPEVNLSISLGAEGGPAAALVTKEMGIKEKVRIYAVDDIDETLALIRSGSIDGTVVTSFFNYGYQAAYWLYQNIKEGKIPAAVKNDAGTILVNKDNIDDYKASLMVKKDL